jgi:hypothetical protein
VQTVKKRVRRGITPKLPALNDLAHGPVQIDRQCNKRQSAITDEHNQAWVGGLGC